MNKSNLFLLIASIAGFFAYFSLETIPEATNIFLLIGAVFCTMSFAIRKPNILEWFKSDKDSNHTSEKD
jgi:intracellular septation protein A